jgi:glutathione synthase/RimK-type ligase-like ATP-grasp enzyme
MLRVGLLTGREKSFPDALIAEVERRNAGVVASYAALDATRIDRPPPYDVLVDRISHEVSCYQPILKLAALNGTRVVNNPFWRIADDKFFNTALAARIGVAVPKTYVLPSKSYSPDVSSETLHNLRYPLDWVGIASDLGFPIFMKPHWGGGWRDVHKVDTIEQLIVAYDKTGQSTMIVQEGIAWTQYVRCLVIGKEHVRPALWNPSLRHFDRYTQAANTMPALTPELEARVVEDARKLCRALGYEMNTVEFGIRDGVPYAIDFMNSAPDFDISSLGPEHFGWVVGKMADLVIDLARRPADPTPPSWDVVLHR